MGKRGANPALAGRTRSQVTLACVPGMARNLWGGSQGGDESMNSQILGLRVASVIFGLMSIAQLVRLLIRPEVLVAGHLMPLWSSALAFVFLGGLSLWMWKLSHTQTN
jgi:hypothetical protein